jgi:carbohydrate diacid regulator
MARRIVERVASGMNKQVCVADPAGAILASSDGRLVGAQLSPGAPACAGGAIVEYDDHQLVGIGLPLIYADAVVGMIVLNDPSPEGRELGRVAKTLAELIIHQMNVIEQLPHQKWIRDKFVYDLLHERYHGSAETMLAEAELLGIDLQAPRLVAVIAIQPIADRLLRPAAPADSLPRIARTLRLEQIHATLLDRVRRFVAAHEADVYSFIDDDHLVVLAAVDPSEPNARRQQITRDVQRFIDDLAHADGAVVSAGVGWYHPGWQALAQSCIEAQLALEIGTSLHGPGRVFQVEALGLAAYVCSEDRTLKAELSRRLLLPLDDSELLATLEAFLQASLSPSATARALHVHRHTLAYRLDRITHRTGLDPREFAAAAQFYAALVLRKMRPPSD